MTLEKLENLANMMLELIYENHKFGWEDVIGNKNSSDRVRQYGFVDSPIILPSIRISNDECTFYDDFNNEDTNNIFDLLGVYRYKANNVEGEIILFSECIHKCAERIYEGTIKNSARLNRHYASVAECEELIYKIVLYHELGHWISHWMLDTSGNRWIDDFTNADTNLKEGIAQTFTYFFILRDVDCRKMKFIFEHMLFGQMECYHKHLDIQNSKNFSMEKFLLAIEKIRAEKPQLQNLNVFLGLL